MLLSALMFVFALSGCSSAPPAPTAEDVARAVLSGDLSQAVRLAADPNLAPFTDPAQQPLVAELDRWAAVDAQRRALSSASHKLLQNSVQQRIRDGDLSGAAAHLSAALTAWPDDPVFLDLAHQLGSAAEQAPPNTAIEAWQILAELLADRPEDAASWQERATRAALAQAYGPGLADTRTAQAGIQRAAAAALLGRVDAEYVDVPDWSLLSRAGRQRLTWLVATDGARAAWPKVTNLAWPPATATDLDSAITDLDAALAIADQVELPQQVVIDEWVAGALGALDPWTRAVWPAGISAWEDHNAGVRVGVGVDLDQTDGQVTVRRPLLDPPAWTGGVHQDDVVEWIGQKPRLVLADLPAERRLDAATQALAGEPGSVVLVGLKRGGQALELSLRRGSVQAETVSGLARGPDNAWTPWIDEEAGIAYARITTFKPTTEASFDALLDPVSDRIRAVVLDLRGNPGGDVNAAVQVADRFVCDGWLAQVSGRVLPETGPDTDPVTGAPLAEWNQAVPGHALEGVLPVVLVDGRTASAAEVLAGALQERAAAIVVGSPTWGKGYAQALRADPEHGYAVQLTNLVWTTPEGHRLTHRDGGGIVPQLTLSPSSPGEDFRLSWLIAQRAALRVHQDGTPMHPVGSPAREDLPELSEDPGLLAGLIAARARLLGG
ncbi:MAG: hypothetical protein GXP62_18310 [Oligoflexia bacterium]|nr:hypothetical protein [Oligoflexia bacterium]